MRHVADAGEAASEVLAVETAARRLVVVLEPVAADVARMVKTRAGVFAEQARLFREYAGACLDHPRYVGCHWFQYHDQPASGRFDGENFACGLTSVCDVPHPELVLAAREIAGETYRRRAAK